jgi:AGCS family alanine or glycine:cation symporter
MLYTSCLFLILGSIFISIKTRFIQLRLIPKLFKLTGGLFSQGTEEGSHTIRPYKALFTAMSTTLGIGTIVAPVIAIYMGGPGALIGFLLTSFFGSAATYVEVSLAVQSREVLPSGAVSGGPMPYLKRLLSPAAAKWYAGCCFILMMTWSGAQANQLAAMLSSPLLGELRIPAALSGGLIGVVVLFLLFGGIKRIGAVEAKLVPIKFTIYLGACFFILFSDLPKLGHALSLIFSSAFSPSACASGIAVGGLMQALRWGIFKGTQCCEAGIGTQTIPHSMAETKDPVAQGTLAMLSTFAAGFVAFLSGCVCLVTQTWQDPTLPLGMSMVAASFQIYFSSMGVFAVASSALVFAFGTILGNSYNGSEAFKYLSKGRNIKFYYVATALLIFLGAISDVKMVWALTDIVLACMALPHMAALILHVVKEPNAVAVTPRITD